MTKRQILLPAVLAAAVAAAPAQAHKPEGTDKPQHPAQAKGPKADHGSKGKGTAKRCAVRAWSYVAHGTVDAAPALTANPDGTYDGTLVVDVTRANHHGKAHKGTTQTYTLDDAKVKFAGTPDRNADGKVDAADVLPGDRVKVKGKITAKRKRCATTATDPATGVVTVKKVTFKAPKAAKPSEKPAEQEPAAPSPRKGKHS